MNRSLAIIVIALCGCATARLWPGGPSSSGRRDFERSCAVCHGREGRGDGPAAQSLRKSPPDLTILGERHVGVFPETYVIDVVTGRIEFAPHGTREMPIWSDRFSPSGGGAVVASIFSRRSANAVAQYVKTIQRSSQR